MSNRPTVVQFGAGAIGRGFMGQLWTEGGYAVTFLDVNRELVDDLYQRGSYPLRLVDTDVRIDLRVAPISARPADGHMAEVPSLIRHCAFVCTAVGVNAFPYLARPLARSVMFRSSSKEPLNIVCCENQRGAASILGEAVADELKDASVSHWRYFNESVAFVDSSVGRMVPPPSPETLREDPLLIVAEPYKELPIDAAAWRGLIPTIPGLQPKHNFTGYVDRKLFTHNGGHALLAYEGYRKGHTYLWQCAEDPELLAELRGYWQETGEALVAAYGLDAREQRAHEADLLRRFGNRALGDTVVRVARDPARKLRCDDRLVGAALLCLDNGITPIHAARAIVAALQYDAPDDPTAAQVLAAVARGGVREALSVLSGVPAGTPLADLVVGAYNGRRG
jgi:mannitol-1-phosphate 5-dehydrogenase